MNWLDRAAPYRDAAGDIDWLAYATASDVHGFAHPCELSRLVELATGKDVLEVGSFRGLSAWCMAHVASHITCVDTFCANSGGQVQMAGQTTYIEFRRNLAPFDDILTCLPFASERAAELIPEGKQFDFVFLDAMHDYESCRRDIELWWPRVKPGGVLALHDYRHQHFPGVEQAADEFFGPAADGDVTVTLRVVRKP